MGLFPRRFGWTHGGTHPAHCHGQGAWFNTSKTSSLGRNRGVCWSLNLAIPDLPLGWELKLLWVQHFARALSDLRYPFCPSSHLFEVQHQVLGRKPPWRQAKLQTGLRCCARRHGPAHAELSTCCHPMKTAELTAF